MLKAFALSSYSLWLRELKRFYRQPSRIIGAVASPLLFWILIGAGLGNSFRSGAGGRELGYLEYFFPGTLLMILLFTAIFSTISLIEDRREGFLQSVLVSPVPRTGVVFGKILGGTSLSVCQGALFLAAAPFLGMTLSFTEWLIVFAVLFLNGFMMTSLGFYIAWKMNSIQGFHAMMNLVLMPLWILSGALFPPGGAPQWIQWAIRINPLGYGLSALRRALYGGNAAFEYLPSFSVSLALTAAFGGIFFFFCALAASRRSAEDLQ